MKIAGYYRNGNYRVYIMEDGTKIRSSDDDTFIPDRVESIDLKITDYCNMGCKFCYENSTINGKHADLNNKLLDTFPEYTEVAIGGGNPLSHPQLEEFLKKLKEERCFANITVNQVHFIEDIDRLRKMRDDKMIRGIGVSIINPDKEVASKMLEFPNSVAHVIAGITSIGTLKKMSENGIKKVLILGYKTTGRGNDCYFNNEDLIKMNISEVKNHIPEIREMFDVISFDNLAIKQLDIKDTMNKEEWDNFYMGDDGNYTMYIDLVNEEYAKNSTSGMTYDLLNDINEMFLDIKSKTKEKEEIKKL